MSNNIDFNKITPCGGCCDECPHFISKECIGCRNNEGKCVKMWSDGCSIYKCCNEHNVLFCGLCDEFPCGWITKKISEWKPNGIDELTELAMKYRIWKDL